MFAIGEPLFLEYRNTEEGPEIQRFRSRILEYNAEKIGIDLPINEKTGRESFFPIGTSFKGWILVDQAMFSFHTALIDRKKAPIPMLFLTNPGEKELERAQRRQYVRVSTLINTAVHPYNGEFLPFITTTLDLSGGGAAIALPKEHLLKVDMDLRCWFVLPMQSGEQHYLDIDCQIVRLYLDRSGEKKRASLKFINIKENERVLIIRYCFEQEVLQRQKLTKLRR